MLIRQLQSNIGNALLQVVLGIPIQPEDSTERPLVLPGKLKGKLGFATAANTMKHKYFATSFALWIRAIDAAQFVRVRYCVG